MGGVRRGIVFTVSTVLLASAFLYLLASISMYSDSAARGNTRIIEVEKVNMQFDTASYGMERLLTHMIANVSWEGTNVSFEENLSSAGNGEYYAAVSRFGQFLEAFGLVDSSINITEARRPAMLIYPQNITVDHFANSVRFTPVDSGGSAGEVESYTVLMKVGMPTPAISWGQFSEAEESDPDAVHFHVGVEGTNGTVHDSKYLYKYNTSEIMLLNKYNQSILGIQVSSPAALQVGYNVDIYLKTIIGLRNQSSVELGEDIVTVDGGGWGNKTGKVLIHDS